MNKFTERDTENFYDHEDSIYQSFWDKDGSLHWGFFDQNNQSFLKASKNLTNIMIEKSKIDKDSKVLDLGCGNGEVAIYIANKTGCQITGVDLSGVRIENAKKKLENNDRVDFLKATATDLPFEDNSFTHIWSQAVIYHIHDKEKALREIYRVLKKDGIFIFDDLLKLKENISEDSKKYVYDRLLFDTPFSFQGYQNKLKELGFNILKAIDLSDHLKKNYQELIKILENKLEENTEYIEEYKKLIFAYQKMVEAVDNDELGWGLFLCGK